MRFSAAEHGFVCHRSLKHQQILLQGYSKKPL